MKDNIIKFKSKNKITENEINGLFFGLVKLIKNFALDEAKQMLPKDIKTMNDNFESLQLELSKKDQELERLREENKQLQSKIKQKNLKILQLSCLSAKRLKDQQA